MHRRDAAQHKFDHGNRRFPISLIPLGLAGSGTNKFSSLMLENLKYRPLDDAAPIAFLMISTEIYVWSGKFELLIRVPTAKRSRFECIFLIMSLWMCEEGSLSFLSLTAELLCIIFINGQNREGFGLEDVSWLWPESRAQVSRARLESQGVAKWS